MSHPSHWPACPVHVELEPCQVREGCQCPPQEEQKKPGARHLPECKSCWSRRKAKA